ncbi:MAG: hypothetical protein ACHP7N_15855 [Caulobacterales bacterium]
MSAPETDSQRAVSRFWGGMLIAVGGLIGGLCGLCTFGFVGFGVWGLFNRAPETLAMIPTALIIGGIPTAFGAILVWLGRGVLRRHRKGADSAAAKAFE